MSRDSKEVLRVSDLQMTYGQGSSALTVLGGLSLDVHHGEFVCIVGPSGAGKTTLLRCVSGLQTPSSGAVVFDGRKVDGPPPALAVVFQDYSRSLLPWMTISDNVELPLRRTAHKAERRERSTAALESVGLGGKGKLYPWQLSGGMQQRAAIARALVYRPDMLLMDEPFAAVDAQTRIDLEDLVLRMRDEFDMTVVFVTHDIDEAVYLGDRVIVLSGAPASVTEDVRVDLPRPRDQMATKSLPEYARLRNHVLGLIQAAKRAVAPSNAHVAQGAADGRGSEDA